MMTSFPRSLAVLVLTGFANSVIAQIIGTTGAIVVVANPPTDVFANQWESNTQIRAFSEQQNLLLTAGLPVDISVPGTSPDSMSSNLSPATIPAGTTVSSFYLHYDVVGQPANALEAMGSITFGQNVIGIEVMATSINQTDALLGRPGINYGNGTMHGLELNPAGGGTSDVLTLTADRRTIILDLRVSNALDDLRVITAIPEPSSIALLGIASGGYAGMFFRRIARSTMSQQLG